MKFNRSALVYTALALIAIVAGVLFLGTDEEGPVAEAIPTEEIAALENLREGLMRKLNFHSVPEPRSEVSFTDPDGGVHTLADYEGKIVVLNFWATWCAPCRKEMPSLDNLQTQLGGDDFAVVTIATSRNPMPAITRFFEEEGVTNLPILLDPQGTMAADFGAFGLPVTVILNREGQEIARLTGDAEWDTESAISILTRLIEGS